jgi:ATP-binding cassette subfamily F protein uup
VLEEEEKAAHRLDRKIVREEHWLRYGVTARRKRNVRRLEGLHNLRKQRREAVAAQGRCADGGVEADGSGSLVVAADRITTAFGHAAPVVRDVSTRILRGDPRRHRRADGAGKTTLLSILTGQLAPDGGEVRLGTGLQMVDARPAARKPRPLRHAA